MTRLSTLLTKLTSAFGFRLVRMQNSLSYRRMKFLIDQEITLVIDVGANRGQFARAVRRGGYLGKIISFEPIPEVYQILLERCQQDPHHVCKQLALGAIEGHMTINILNSDASSSLLVPNPKVMPSIPSFQNHTSVTVPMTTLDVIQEMMFADSDRVYLKIDTQGYELEVIKGGTSALEQIVAIETELSFVELYSGQPLLPELWNYLNNLGYRAIWADRGYVDPTSGYMLQCDAIFSKLVPVVD